MESPEDGYQFGWEIGGYASDRVARLRATIADPVALAAAIDQQVEAIATRARQAKLTALKSDGMSLSNAVAWSEGALRGYRERMAEHEPVH